MGAPAAPTLSLTERIVAAALASGSGLAVLAYAFARVPMAFTVPFVALPASLLLAGVVLFRRGAYARLHRLAAVVVRAAGWGLAATLVYDVVRPLLRLAFRYRFSPLAAISMFGHLITGRPLGDPIAETTGWLYHFWNGVSFAVMFGVLRPKGGVLAGVAWAMLLQGFMMAAYPAFLRIRLDTPGFLVTGIVGHALWGAVLGAGLRRGRMHA